MSKELFDKPLSIRCSVPGFRRGGVSHPAGPTDYPAGKFTVEQIEQMGNEPRLSMRIIEASEPAPEAVPSEQAEGILDDEKLADGLMSGDELAGLVAYIAELDSENSELWMEGGAPKVSAMPSGTSADERDAAWIAYQSMIADADIVSANDGAGE